MFNTEEHTGVMKRLFDDLIRATVMRSVEGDPCPRGLLPRVPERG